MNKIVWKSEYSVGVARLDEQHKKIIKIINTLIDNPKAHSKSGTINDTLAELTNYVSGHFLLEEQLLEENSYPNLLEHSEKHTAYSDQIAKFCADTMNKNSNIPIELLYFLREWWIEHILYEDMNYKVFLNNEGVT